MDLKHDKSNGNLAVIFAGFPNINHVILESRAGVTIHTHTHIPSDLPVVNISSPGITHLPQ